MYNLRKRVVSSEYITVKEWRKRRRNRRRKCDVVRMVNIIKKRYNISAEWRVKFIEEIDDDRTLGQIQWNNTIFSSGDILLREDFSLKGNLEDLRGIILHEISHIIAGYRSFNHGRYWKRIAEEMGAITRFNIL